RQGSSVIESVSPRHAWGTSGLWDPAEQIELVVRSHRDQVGHAVRKREERCDGADVPDVFVAEAMTAKLVIIGVGKLGRMQRDLERKGEHRFLSVADVGSSIVDRDAVGDERILGVEAKNRSMRDDAVKAIVGTRG